MPSSLNLSLTDDLKAFVERQSGDGTLYPSSGEFVRTLIREKKDRIEAARFRESVLEGCQDILAGRTVEYKGSIREVLKQAKEAGWLD